MQKRLYNFFLLPRSSDEDTRRREFILNVLLLGSIGLTVAALLKIFAHFIVNLFVYHQPYNGAGEVAVFAAFAFFTGIYLLSRIRFYWIACYLFIGLYFLLGVYTTYIWGNLLPQTPLVFVLVIVMSSILIGTRFSLLVAGMVAASVLIMNDLRINQVITVPVRIPSQATSDLLIDVVIFGIIVLVSWLSNSEIEKSLRRAKQSEAELKRERDLLEVKVEARTRELKQAQVNQMTQLYRFAEFGRLSSGLIHDLANPLTTISVSLEEFSASPNAKLLKQSRDGIRKIEQYIETARAQIRNETQLTVFSIEEEIKQVILFLHHKASVAKVKIKIAQEDKQLRLYGNPVKLNQVISNLVSNAIDAYEGVDASHDRLITITVIEAAKETRIEVRDFGKGISRANLGRIFTPFFSTKDLKNGSGIGLSICKDIVEKDFRGQIDVASDRSSGTVFRVTLPYGQSIRQHH
ncbi:GHKL domain-containing protein [Patescibacteria group bacterium]|nr:GHKL domain-containing protein [Patescibacteria group bacterium]